ncbi:hypothetical protein PIB30_097759, partial [Stylosanthes scabra]|nr:hypothetical protein [Stylosanthes scabra]
GQKTLNSPIPPPHRATITLHSHPLNTSTFTLTVAQPCYRCLSCRRASTASSSDSSSPAVPWRCRLFCLCPCFSVATRDIVQFVYTRHCSAAGHRLPSPRRASSKPLPPVTLLAYPFEAPGSASIPTSVGGPSIGAPPIDAPGSSPTKNGAPLQIVSMARSVVEAAVIMLLM